MTRAAVVLSVAVIVVIALPARAWSQTRSPEDRAAADALYNEASELMTAGRFAEACPKLETSDRLDPGIGTIIRLGYCYERLGRTASAWAAYNDGEARARKANDKRADEAANLAKAVETKLSRLRIVPENPAPGQEIVRDGKTVDAGTWGAAMPLDPGEHEIEARAPGRTTWKSKVTVSAPGVTTTNVPALAVVGLTGASPPATPFWSGQRIAGVTLGAVGVVAMGVGSAFTVLMVNKNHASMPYCPMDPSECYAQGVNLRNQALDAAHVATGTFVSGAVVAASGLIVFLTAPKAQASVTPLAGPGAAGVVLTGAF